MTDWNKEFEEAAEEIESATATIRKDGPAGKPYCVYSKDGSRKFGCYSTRQAAIKRLRQIEHFSKNEAEDEG